MKVSTVLMWVVALMIFMHVLFRDHFSNSFGFIYGGLLVVLGLALIIFVGKDKRDQDPYNEDGIF
jgi:hypothetical protein